jgi:urease accessory protein
MLVEAPVGNLSSKNIPDQSIDWLDLAWSQCLARATRAQTRRGVDVRILLRIGMILHHGDVLRESPDPIAVNILPCDTLVGRPRDARESAAVCYALGDLHVPVQMDQQSIVTIDDGPTRQVFERFKVTCTVESRRFEPTHRPLVLVVLSPEFQVARNQSQI